MVIGSRLQYGINVVPSDWRLNGSLTERATSDEKLKGFRILTLARPGSAPKGNDVDADAFVEVPCEFMGSTPVVTVFSQDGEKHRFTIDTGAVRSYMQVNLVRSLNAGGTGPVPLCFYLPNDKWIHFKGEFDPSIAVLAYPNPDFPVDGILGMNAISCLQLKVDYRARKLWARISSKPLEAKESLSELGVITASKAPSQLVTIPMRRLDSGRYAVDVVVGSNTLPVEIDTGASVLGLPPGLLAALHLERVGDAQVLVQNGPKQLSKYLAPDARIGGIKLLWPIIHEGADARAEVGGLGPSVLPHSQVLIDYPGLRLLTIQPTDDESVAQAAGQIIAGAVKLEHNEVVMDMPDVFGPSKAVLTKVQDRPVASFLSDLRLLNKGDAGARMRLLELYKSVIGPKGHITIRQNGAETTVEIGQSHPSQRFLNASLMFSRFLTTIP
jgi:hypothetical protein